MPRRTSRSDGLRLSSSVLALALLTACAGSPVVTWTPPTAPAGASSASFDHAQAYTAAARNAYQTAISQQVNGQAHLANALLATGALTAALALGGVHSSAVIGTAFVAGAGYGYGQLTYDRRRLLIYQAGVEAINCANRAVAPFAIGADDAKSLSGAIVAVGSNRDAVATARADLVQAMREGTIPQASPDLTDAQKALDAADRVSAAAGQAQIGAQAYLNAVRRVGGDLILAVDRIDAAVVRATLDTLPDLSAVPKIVAGLAGMAGMFVPPAGSDKLLRDSVAASLGSAKNNLALGEPSEAIAALRARRGALNDAVRQLSEATLTLQAGMAGRDGVFAPDAFKDCGVTDVAFPLAVSADTVTLKPGVEATRSVLISGGTRPYVIDVEGSPVAGLSVKGPAPFESRIVITATASVKAPGEQSILVMDSSTPSRNRSITVKVDDGSGSAVVPKDTPRADAVTPAQVLEKLKGLSFKLTASGAAVFKVANPAVNGADASFTLNCDPKPATDKKPTRATLEEEVKNQLMTKLSITDVTKLGVNLVATHDNSCSVK